MTDTISLVGLRATGHHGVLAQERRDGQIFVVDVDLVADIRPAAAADDLDLTVDYAAVAGAVVARIQSDPVDLIETLAEQIAQMCLAFPGVVSTTITVHKPQAPVGVPFDDVMIRIMREA